MPNPSRLPPLADAQLEIMNVVWDLGEASVADIWDVLSKQRSISRNTVQTVMTRLREKGWQKRIWMLPDNKTLVSSSRDSGVRMWNADTGKLLRELDLEGKRLAAMDLSHDAKAMVAVVEKVDFQKREATYELRLWNTSTWQSRSIATWTGFLSDGKCVAISPDSTTVATGNELGNVRFWDVASGDELLNYSVGQRATESLAFSPAGTLVAIATGDGVFLWDWRSGEAPKAITASVVLPQKVTFSPDGRLLVTGGGGQGVAARIWDVASRQRLRTLKGKSQRYAVNT